jgi:nitrate reductase NapAB chaperone NapD
LKPVDRRVKSDAEVRIMPTPPETVVSGLLLCSRPEHLEQVADAVQALPWAEVRDVDPAGRLLVITEADGIEQGMDRMKELRALPGVVVAELAEFRMTREAG